MCICVRQIFFYLELLIIAKIQHSLISLKKQIPTLFDLLEKDENKDSDELEEAQQDLVHMFTCQAVLNSSFPQAVS